MADNLNTTVYVLEARPLPMPREGQAEGDYVTLDPQSLLSNYMHDPQPVDGNTLKTSCDNVMVVATGMLEKASTLAGSFHVESIKLKLGIDSKVGFTFIADAKFEGS